MAKTRYDFANARLSTDGGATWQSWSSYINEIPPAREWKQPHWKELVESLKRPDTVIVDDPLTPSPTEQKMNLYEVAVIDLGDDMLDPEVPGRS